MMQIRLVEAVQTNVITYTGLHQHAADFLNICITIHRLVDMLQTAILVGIGFILDIT